MRSLLIGNASTMCIQGFSCGITFGFDGFFGDFFRQADRWRYGVSCTKSAIVVSLLFFLVFIRRDVLANPAGAPLTYRYETRKEMGLAE